MSERMEPYMATRVEDVVEAEIQRAEGAARDRRVAKAEWYAAQDARREVRLAAARALLGQPNPETNKPYSRTAAMDAAEETPQYQSAVVAEREAELELMAREAREWAARLRAERSVRMAGI